MKHLKTEDKNSLVLLLSVVLTLIAFNSPLFIKSLARSTFSFPSLQILANSLNLSPLRQKEQALWSLFKEVNLQLGEEQGNTEVAENFSGNDTTLQEDVLETISQPASATETQDYKKFLLIGDSTMYELGLILNSDLRKKYNIRNVRLDYRISTGLNRKDYYNWHEKTPEFIESYAADVVIAIFGGNDDQAILDSQGNYHAELSEGWKETYQERVEEYAQIVENSSVKKMYWVGQPISNVSRFNKFYPIFNQIYREVSEKYDKIEFIDTWDAFIVDGTFSPIMPDASGKRAYVRANDGNHFTPHGARILGDLVIGKMLQEQVIKSESDAGIVTENISNQDTALGNETEEETLANTTEENEDSYKRFLLIGDSTMYDLGIILNNDLRKGYGIKNIRLDSRPSSGLNRKDYYNWHQKTPEFIESYSADVVVAIFGGNEDQIILDAQGQYHSRFSETWAEVYRERVEEYAQIIEDSSVKKMYWVGQPISNVSRFNELYPVLNQIYRDISEKYDKIEFIDTWEAFAVNGQFSPVISDSSGKKAYVRVNDGVHFTAHGANILGDLIVNRMAQDQVIQSVK